MKRAYFVFPLIVVCVAATLLAQTPIERSIEEQVESLLSRMTLEEKVGQMVQYSGFEEGDREQVRAGKIGSFLNVVGAEKSNEVQRIAVEESRLGIPLLFGFDVIHGFRTIFPIPLAEASTWDPVLAEKAARLAAEEATAAGIRWTFAPMVDIARDPRWGRIAEGAGEDPHLGSVFAAARVRGFQGNNLADPSSLAACAKHYAAYGAAEGGRDYNTADLSRRTLREIYLPPFRASVEAGAVTLMSAFNEVNGIPASANPLLLERILRDEWGFEGFVVSDWNAIRELLNHGFAATPKEAGKQAVRAGVDMDMEGAIYANHLADLVREGVVPEALVDQAVRRILQVKFQLGLFDNPYVDPRREQETILSERHRRFARELAKRSIVLLKNDNNLLPLDKSLKSVAVIGPLADNQKDPLGTWPGEGQPADVVSLLAGIQQKLGTKAKLFYAKGAEVLEGSEETRAEAVRAAQEAEVVILALGETAAMSGEASSRAYLGLPRAQRKLLKAVYETGVPIVLVLMNGRPLAIPWAAEHVPAIVEAWHLGVETGNAVADVLFGNFNPSGKLPVSFPRAVGQVPIYYNHKNTGRPPTEEKYTSKYLDVAVTPLYPFGYGLSYTEFAYSNLRLSSQKISSTDSLLVQVDVENAGERKGEEIVQLYVRDLVGDVTRPVKELKGFKKISLQPGEKRTVNLRLPASRLAFYDSDMKHRVEPGRFKLWVGPNSAEGLETHFEVAPD